MTVFIWHAWFLFQYLELLELQSGLPAPFISYCLWISLIISIIVILYWYTSILVTYIAYLFKNKQGKKDWYSSESVFLDQYFFLPHQFLDSKKIMIRQLKIFDLFTEVSYLYSTKNDKKRLRVKYLLLTVHFSMNLWIFFAMIEAYLSPG